MEITHITLEGRSVCLSIRRHSRARRISLRLSAARDAVVVTLPVRVSVVSGLDFVRRKAIWVLKNLETDGPVALEDDARIPILGKEYRILRMSGRGVSQLIFPSPLTGEGWGGGEEASVKQDTDLPPSLILPHKEGGDIGELQVHCSAEFVARRTRDFLQKYLRNICFARASEMAASIGKTVKEVRIGNTRSRWGSCTPGGKLTFHWQLVFAPPLILHYLLAHEVAHLKEMNHSDKFWKIVAELCPEYLSARAWLKREGHSLHRYGK